ncbi:MAG: 50S ribosomal protein L11 methyltransferase [Chitinophagaceae bacterium]|nr:50S ribosomal protein L11 methyltransferase [Chitinophagaceae bacterium]
MSNHIQITITDIQPEQQDVLIAHLSEAGFEGFEQNDLELKAFIAENSYDKKLLDEMAFKYQLSFNEQVIPGQNWNALWESNFQPVIVDDFVAIRADFHEPIKNVEYEIVITPKMSFGTGHHATTYMMVQQMRNIDLNNKTVFDFGTGTGVLAILAEKSGAKEVIAVDNDDWSISNAEENIQNNNCSRIKLKKADSAEMTGHFDIILANINKNVIVENFPSLVSHLNGKGTLLLSGLLEDDEADILAEACKYPLVLNAKTSDRGWISLRFNH